MIEQDEAPVRTLRIVHVFPDLLSTYGDIGNIRTLVVRAERRAIRVVVDRVLADSPFVPVGDLFVIGGGQDRDQIRVEAALVRLGPGIEKRISEGAALLAVCAGYQNLGRTYRFADGRTLHGPGIFPVETIAAPDRLVGPAVVRMTPGVAMRIGGDAMPERTTVVGFENHSGRTYLDATADALAVVEVGNGNNGEDRTEGLIAPPADGRGNALWIGTYLHGPLLPRNPHIADALIRAGLACSDQPNDLVPVDDRDDWRAHDNDVDRNRRRTWVDRLVSGMNRAVGSAVERVEP
jgi:lipid II isoglutaminyl synthase (glutamine-hydrolysing)